MPTGMQDWWLRSSVNIIAQDVAELIQRPKYGAGQAIDIQVLCPAGEITSLCIVNAKGLIYWGHIYAPGSVAHDGDQPQLFLEDSLISTQSFGTLRARMINAPWKGSMYIMGYSYDDTEMSAGIGPGNTFESKVELRYNNKSTEDITVYGALIYAVI